MRPEKAFVVEDLQERFQKSPFLFVADYTGLNVAQFGDLRNRLVEAGARCQVVKNSFLQKAAAKVGLPDFSELLGGQTAVVTGEKDVCAAAKVVKKFSGETKKFSVKVGVLDNRLLNKTEIDALAEMPSKEILQSQLLGLLQTPATNLVRLLNEPASMLARLLQASAEKQEKAAA